MPALTAGLAALVGIVEELASMRARGRVVIGIAGSPGAGKTTLALLLLDELRRRHSNTWAAHLPMDGFHLADAQLDRLGLRAIKGAPKTFDRGGYAVALRRARAGGDDIYVPGFERDLEQPLAAALHIPAEARVVISEGNYLLLEEWNEARAACDEVWFVTTDDRTRRHRLEERHTAFGKSPNEARAWVEHVDEANARLVRTSAQHADRHVLNGVIGWTEAPVPPSACLATIHTTSKGSPTCRHSPPPKSAHSRRSQHPADIL